MKQFKSYSGMAAVCAMLTFASCGNDIELTEAQAPVKGEYKVTITASQESSATRTAVDGSNVVWQTGDAITVFDGAGENCSFEIVKGVGTTLGEFDGTITVTEPKKYSAVYPLEPDAGILSAAQLVEDNIISADDVDESAVYIGGLTLSGEQVATPNGFDPLAAIMTARNDNADKITSTSEDLSLGTFKHVCAFVKVTTTEPYDKITFTANGGDSIAGGFVAQVGADGVSKVIPTDPTCTVSLVPAVEGTKIAAGTYFIAILPGALEEGFTMSCTSIDSENDEVTTMVRSYNATTSAFSRHNAVNMGTVEEGVTAATWTRNTQKYVDLGLSVKWATCNVGATTPTGYGDYFAWGEVEQKNDYSWETYKWCENSETSMTKYCTNSSKGIVDNKTVLELADDAAHRNWGGVWRMPTAAEFNELRNDCYWEWTEGYDDTDVKGYIIYQVKSDDDKGIKKEKDSDVTPTASYNINDDNHIFLPAAGLKMYKRVDNLNSVCDYWGASLGMHYWSKTTGAGCNLKDSERAYNMYASSYWDWSGNRYPGESVRPVLP